MLDEHKICFIICSNNESYLNECLFYISQLEVPQGYSIDAISILDAKSMTGGYNEGMRSTDAKYKIYLHQDVFIIYKGFLRAVLDIFHSDASIGMIGMVGAPKMSVSGVMWYGHREGELYGVNPTQMPYDSYEYQLNHGLYEVEAVDGLMMITREDIPWREDKFDGWDFYDVSQSFEFRKKGYKVVVPEQLNPWCKHDDGVLNLANYNKYRKICMEEYPEYFYPERFQIGRREQERDKQEENRGIRVLIIARNQFQLVQKMIDTLKTFSDLDERQLVIVDNGSEDGLRHWLKNRKDIDYLICGEVIEGYATILNEVMSQFGEKEDLLILSPCLMLLPRCIDTLRHALEEDGQIGAVCARTILRDSEGCNGFKAAIEYAQKHTGTEKREILGLPFEAVLIRKELLEQIGRFEEQLVLPESTMTDFSFRGVLKKYRFYEMQNAYVYKIADNENAYRQIFGRDVDRKILKEKWDMNYFNAHPNNMLLDYVEEEKEKEFQVLEIGCDCGVNLLYLKNRYPKVQLYGIEINPSAAAIASHIAQVQVANIEEKALGYEKGKFDYIIFGDVLEHLREPEETIRYCKSLLSENGRIIACIPNLMHYSVMRQLLNGDFTYTDMGLLDKTHVHFFTYKEIVRMFDRAEYTIDKMSCRGGKENATEEDRKFVSNLLSFSGEAKEFMFYTFQYLVSAKNN